MWSVAGVVLMNVTLQFLLYPSWDKALGSEAYGNVLYYISLMNIVAASLGHGSNNARMVEQKRGGSSNRAFFAVLTVATGLLLILTNAVRGLLGMDWLTGLLFSMLVVATLWRSYADVDFRLRLDYKGYFLYYVAISVGYGLGWLLFSWSSNWIWALLPGEILAVLFVLLRGDVLRPNGWPHQHEFWDTARSATILFSSTFCANLIFNCDRVLLKWLLGGTAVTTYYLASLIGKTMALITTPLNSVLIGYLMRYKGTLSKKMLGGVALGSAAAAALVTGGCIVASAVLLPILYPTEYEEVKPYLWLGNLAQIVYFIGNVINVMLLRFGKKQDQLYVNILYGVLFVALCVPLTYFFGLWGFCGGYLATTVGRLVFGLVLNLVRSRRAPAETA